MRARTIPFRAARPAPPSVAAPGSERPNRLCWALFFFIIIVISAVNGYVSAIGMLRPGLILWLFIVLYPLAVPSSLDWSNLTQGWIPKALAILFACTILSIPFGLSTGPAARFFLDSYIRVLLFAVILLLAIRSVRDLAFLVWGYVTAVGILAVLTLTVMKMSYAAHSGIQRLEGESMYDSNDMGVLVNIGLPLTLLCLQTSKRRGKIAAFLVLLGIPMMVAKFGSRGALLGLVSVGLVLLFTASHVALAKRILVVPVVALALFVAAPEGYWDQMGTILNPEEDYNLTSDHGRKAVAERGLGYMVRYPLFGVGLNNFGRAEGTISEIARTAAPGTGVQWIAAHNTFIQVGAELGLIALVTWLTLLVGCSVGTMKLRKRLPAAWARGSPDQRFLYFATIYLPCAIIGFAIPSTFVSHAYLPGFYILAVFTSALFILTDRELRRTTGVGVWSRSGRRGRPVPGNVPVRRSPGMHWRQPPPGFYRG